MKQLPHFRRRHRPSPGVLVRESIDAHTTMTHKTPKIDAMLEGMEEIPGFDRHYVGYFRCFNAQLYYEAHDVLEEVWLPLRGQPQAKFYQGLIQMAGGFVHLQKLRLGPAARLFALALANFEDYPARHAGVDLDVIR